MSGLNESRPASGERGHDLRARDEVHRRGLAVVAPREVAVVGRHDRVRRARRLARAAPLADARPARVREHRGADRRESAPSWPSRSRVARTRSEPGVTSRGAALCSPRRASCARHVGGAAHVLVRRVRAAADQRRGDRVDEAVLRVGDLGGEARDRARAVRRVRADDVRLERREVELEHALVVLLRARLDLGVGREQRAVPLDRAARGRRAPVARR